MGVVSTGGGHLMQVPSLGPSLLEVCSACLLGAPPCVYGRDGEEVGGWGGGGRG